VCGLPMFGKIELWSVTDREIPSAIFFQERHYFFDGLVMQ
jgi:hypothetical protein